MSAFSIRAVHVAPRGVARSATKQAWAYFVAMLQARASRRLLMELDQRMLADIGIDHGTAMTEASRPMWDLAPRRR